MHKESKMFVGSVVVSTALFGLHSVAALFVFGFVWLVFSDETCDPEHYT